MPTARNLAAAAVVDNKIYVIGGSGGSQRENQRYDPITDTWATMTQMPTARTNLTAVALNRKIYAIGGFTGVPRDEVEEYDPDTDSWTSKADMPTARRLSAAVALAGKIYVIGGNDGSTIGTVEIFDPVANLWQAGPDMITARESLAAAVVAGRFYAIGGKAVDAEDIVESYDPGVSRVVSSLTADTLYGFKSIVRNINAWPTAESVIASTVTAAYLPQIPAGGAFSGVTDTSMTITWDANGNGGAIEYYVWGATQIGAFSVNDWAVTVSTGFVSLTPNTTYTAYAKARNSAGLETPWRLLGATATVASLPGFAVSTFTTVATSSIAFRWTYGINPPDTDYVAEISSYPDFSLLAQSSQTLLNNATFFSLTPNTTHYFRVKARNFSGLDTAYVGYGSTATLAVTPATAVSTFSMVAVTSMTVRWTASMNPPGTTFICEIDEASDFSSVDFSSVTKEVSAYFDTVAPNTLYYAQVKTRSHAHIDSAYLTFGSSRTLAAMPIAAASTFTAINVSSITVDWQENGNPGGTIYQVQASTSADFIPVHEEWQSANSQLSFITLSPNVTYYARVRAKNAGNIYTPFLEMGWTMTLPDPPLALPYTAVSTTSLVANWTR
ncbi:MAG: kelch repeat-containing protein, partial [Elusimicrobiota bacterium]